MRLSFKFRIYYHPFAPLSQAGQRKAEKESG
jgi:hypothetical protein